MNECVAVKALLVLTATYSPEHNDRRVKQVCVKNRLLADDGKE
jgi:hypothetical protein